MKKIIVLTGAGVSAESGIPTFRDAGGLWEGHDIMEVASPEGWRKNPELVLEFYNLRRRKLAEVKPNPAHFALVKLEEKFDVTIVTQNVDNLHEQAGSRNVLHLHGELTKAESENNPQLVYDIGHNDICLGDCCEEGHQLRPHVVWFGEAVPKIEEAMLLSQDADIFMVIGTSMAVYPAASLIHYVPDEAEKYIIDKKLPEVWRIPNLHTIEEAASKAVPRVVERLLNS